MEEEDQMEIYQILSALLHLSNVEIKDQSGDRSSISVNTHNLCLLFCNYVDLLPGEILAVLVFSARWCPHDGFLWADGSALWGNGPLALSQETQNIQRKLCEARSSSECSPGPGCPCQTHLCQALQLDCRLCKRCLKIHRKTKLIHWCAWYLWVRFLLCLFLLLHKCPTD